MLDITLVIPAYNEEGQLPACLEAATKWSRGIFKEIVVVNNCSSDTTAKILARYPVRVLFEPSKGLTRARNRAIYAISTEFIAFIDADTHITPQWIDIIQNVFSERHDVVCLSGPRRYINSSWWRRNFLNSFWAIAPVAYSVVGYMILGGNFVARREALLSVGGCNQEIEFYGEDTDLARRLSRLGKVLFRMDFYVYSSARRFEAEGLIKPNIIYALNFLWPVIFKKPLTTKYTDIR